MAHFGGKSMSFVLFLLSWRLPGDSKCRGQETVVNKGSELKSTPEPKTLSVQILGLWRGLVWMRWPERQWEGRGCQPEPRQRQHLTPWERRGRSSEKRLWRVRWGKVPLKGQRSMGSVRSASASIWKRKGVWPTVLENEGWKENGPLIINLTLTGDFSKAD